MTRRRIRFHHSFAAWPLFTLSLAACSFSFKAGGNADATAKPAQTDEAEPAAPSAGKPIPGAQPEAEPEADPAEPSNPTRQPPAETAPERMAPTPTPAVCRVDDAELETLCHQALDPISSNDVEGLAAVLSEDAILTHPSHARGHQRFAGADGISAAADEAGGLRALLHVNQADRVVGTVSNDCRNCRRPFVAFMANTRSGTVEVSVETGASPRIFAIEVSAQVRRPDAKPERATVGKKPARAENEKPTRGESPAKDPASLDIKKAQ